MADKLPTPNSPEDLLSTFHGGFSPTIDSDSALNSDVVEESPEQRFHRLIGEHEREFKNKLRALTNFAKILADDHAKSIRQLKSAYKDNVARTEDGLRPSQSLGPPQQSPIQSSETVQDGELAISRFLPTTDKPFNQATPTPVVEDVARSGLDLPQNPRPQPSKSKLLKNRTRDDEVPAPRIEDQTAANPSVLPRLVDYDDDESADDINHEDPPVEDEATTSEFLSSTNPPAVAPAETPKQQLNRPAPEETPRSGRRGPKRKWAEDEEELMIDTLHHLIQESDGDGTRRDMWKSAEAVLRAQGYDRTYEQMAVKWSMHTRHKCEQRGLTWAANVMRKVPHIPRKRRATSPEGRKSKTQPDSALSSQVKRARKKYKKRMEAEVTKSSLVRTSSLPSAQQTELQHRYTFTGASSDIVQVDWSPDGKYFAAASNSIIDENTNFSDNRPRNLLHGSLPTKTIRELPGHRTEQENGQPRYLYRTVSAVKFAKTGHRMYSGGYDNKLRVWDVQDEFNIQCKAEIQYRNKRIEVMDVAGDQTTILATGTTSGRKSIRIFVGDSNLTEDRQEIRPLREMGTTPFPFAPTCLKFGKAQSQNRLIAGFGQDGPDTLFGEGSDMPFGEGRIAVWQFTEASCVAMSFAQGNTFVSDCTWSPFGDFFVVGCVSDPWQEKESSGHSVVKLYSTTEQEPVTTFSCRARDINDVTFDYGLVTASCTDGSTYVWDRRQPREPLHVLTHGQPAIMFDNELERELHDVGVRYVEWGDNAGQLYTGGSDGILKLWDTRRSPADALLHDIADVGHEILCGRFSPDHSSLLIGDENGQLHLFSKSKSPVAREEFTFKVAERWVGQ